jgi:hypothetical protein
MIAAEVNCNDYSTGNLKLRPPVSVATVGVSGRPKMPNEKSPRGQQLRLSTRERVARVVLSAIADENGVEKLNSSC